MRIQHNIAALNAHRYLSANNDAVAKNLEKLSSGYRINRAGDDAAGLSISEKMRAQIKGLETATKNAQDGVSLVQTAEGNLTEVHSMLNRMVELSTQAANGTYQDLNRAELQKEVTSLTSEIDRISSSANFNGIKLLDGSLGGAKTPTVTDGTGFTTPDVTPHPATVATYKTDVVKGGAAGDNTLTVTYNDESGKSRSVDIHYTGDTDSAKNAKAIKEAIAGHAELGKLFDVTGGSGSDLIEITSKATGANAPQITKIKTTDTTTGLDAALSTAGTGSGKGEDAYSEVDLAGWVNTSSIKVNGKEYTGFKDSTELAAALKKDGVLMELDTGTTFKFKGDPAAGGLVLQIGESNDSYQQVHVSVGKMDSKSLGLGGLDLSTQQGALDAIDTVTKAIDQVSATRGSLGAVQNRLDHTINNLSVTDENMTAAESRIRDVDMAKEMMNFTKNNILTQAAQSMLAQANTLPQGVLQLLR